jgi:hypothetical protein
MPAWVIGVPIGLRVTMVGTLHTGFAVTGLTSSAERKSL